MDDDEDEFEAYFQRAERAPVKQLSQQYSPVARTPTSKRRASLQPGSVYSTQMPTSKRNSPMSSRNSSPNEAKPASSPKPSSRHSLRRRSPQTQNEDVEPSTPDAWPARRFDQSPGRGSRSSRRRQLQLISLASSPETVSTHRSESHSPPAPPPNSARKSRRATLAGDLLQIPPTLVGCDDDDRRSSSVSPPKSSPGPSPTFSSRSRQSTVRRGLPESLRLRETERQLQLATIWNRDASSSVSGGGGQVVRTFMLSAKGVVNVGNVVRDDSVFLSDDDDDDNCNGLSTTVQRHGSGRRRPSTAASSERSPRRSPQTQRGATGRAVYGEMYVDLSSRRHHSAESTESAPAYKVLVVGDHGVGKTELIRHFTTSSAIDHSAVAGDEHDSSSDTQSVTVSVDGQETHLDFIEYSSFFSPYLAPDNDVIKQADAYIVTYSMTDRSSYQWAYSFIDDVTQPLNDDSAADDVRGTSFRSHSVVILVANKSDLVRKRQVSTEEAADACQLRRCKYVEVSATLGHRVDDLLVGIVSQIRLMVRRRRLRSPRLPSFAGSDPTAGGGGSQRSPRSLWSTAGRIKAATKFVVRGLLGKPPSSCSDLMKP